MGLYVRDESVNRLAEEVQKAIGAPTKTEAVRIALERILSERKHAAPLLDRLEIVRKRTMALGTPDPTFDEKRFTDEMWGKD